MTMQRSLLLLTLALMVAATPGILRGAESGEFEIEARALPVEDLPVQAASTGGEFALEGEVASRIDTEKADLKLTPTCVGGALKLGSAECGCFCGGAIFVDGFESGDTTAWSSSVP